jgi:hypothetical protein
MKKYSYYISILILPLLFSCNKEWLEPKTNLSLTVPSTLQDFQRILDNTSVLNSNHTYLGELSSDDFYMTAATWNAQSVIRQNTYIWAANQYPGQTEAISINDWGYPWQRIFYANNVLDGLKSIKSGSDEFNNIKGSALFYRAFNYYSLSQEFAAPYNKSTSNTDLGLPLRLTSEIDINYPRSTVKQTYDQMIADLKESVRLLPITPLYKTRPSKPAAFALLARLYLNMFDYETAGKYADSSLQLYNRLIDYKTLSATANFPISSLGPEVIFHIAFSNITSFSAANLYVDTTLYNSYSSNDYRKTIFFTTGGSKVSYKGSYYGSALLFGGIATDEVLLTRAECSARTGNIAGAMRDLDSLTIKRYKVFVPNTSIDQKDAINKVLVERRKELIYRGLRWTDLRRLNLEGENITLTRVLNNITYTLQPRSKRYVFAIPDDEILTSGIIQNDRND